MKPKYGPCRHCGRRALLRPRNLCGVHYNDPVIRKRYPVLACRSNNRGPSAENRQDRPLPLRPTYYPPGTREKLRVMAQRCQAGLQLFHPEDETRHDQTTAEELLEPVRTITPRIRIRRKAQ